MCQLIGGINECLERLVTERFGLDSWQMVLKGAGLAPSDCTNDETSSAQQQQLNDSMSSLDSTVDLVEAASQVSGHSSDEVLEALGEFMVHYLKEQGYEAWLTCPGGSLKDWMSNLNLLTQHWQSAFHDLAPNTTKKGKGKQRISSSNQACSLPRFHCQENEAADDGSLLLTFYSTTATANDNAASQIAASATAALAPAPPPDFCSLAAPIVKGIVSEVAGIQFGVLIDMTLVTTTATQQPQCTTCWSVSAVDPKDQWKLYRNMKSSSGSKRPTQQSDIKKCPKTGLPTLEAFTKKQHQQQDETSGIGLSPLATQTIFPFHVMVNDKFIIQQVGAQLKNVLLQGVDNDDDQDFIGQEINRFFSISNHDNTDGRWSWEHLCRLCQQPQSFQLKVRTPSGGNNNNSHCALAFKATAIHISDDASSQPLVMFLLTPDFTHLQDLRQHGWTLHDIPLHHNSSQRELLLAREHLKLLQERQQSMEQLGQSLERERNLLESLLPLHAAEGLRAGKTVEPMLHKEVTFFFSDICNFTDICRQLYPWQVIEMLNQLYGVMDFLAKKMGIFKIETIGDAYVGCAGLPKADKEHARNIANFAVAVKHCCRHVLSPVDGAPIQLRIGVHTGPAASGVVGTLNPRFCVFGDTVNTTARHESSGLPGMVHCSGTTKAELERQCPGMFQLQERGFVEMKGKGSLRTFWLDGHDNNPLVSSAGLQQLDAQVKDLLSKTNFKTKMGLEAHPSFMELRQERMKRRQSFLPRNGSLISFGTRSLSSTSSIGSSSMTRTGSTLSRISPLGKVAIDMNGAVSIPLPPGLLKGQAGGTATGGQTKRKSANADWECSSNHSSTYSGESQRTKKTRNDSTGSLTLLDLQKTHNKPCNGNATNNNASARLLQLVGPARNGKKRPRRRSNVFFNIAESCKEAALEDSMSHLGDSAASCAFPSIPDSI